MNSIWSRLACLAFAASACAREPASNAPVDPAEIVTGAIVVDFKDGTTKSQFDSWEQAWGVDLEFASELVGPASGVTVAVGVADVVSTLASIRQHREVEVAEPLMVYRASFVPNDPAYQRQWNLAALDMTKAWDRTRGKGVVVAVLDTGIAYEDYGEFRQVPDLKGARFAEGYDFVNRDTHPNDDHGHGTHVAGTIAQVTHNHEGVAGVAFEASLMPVKVLNHFGSGHSADISEAIRWAADHGAKVINLSLGGGARSEVMEKAVAYARSKGAVVVCAAGNSGAGRVEYPAAYPGAVAVSAVGPSGQKAPYSSYGKEVDLAAPGGDKRQGEDHGILQNTIDPQDPSRSIYASYQGTSMAAPHVAGVAALLFSAGATTPAQVERALFEGAKAAPGQSGWSELYGHGIVNAEASLQALGPSAPVVWSPFWVALGLLVLALLSLRQKERPGYLNVLVRPAFALPLVLGTVGFFVVRWFSSGAVEASGWVELATLPLPDWDRIIFGRGRLANPLFYSALLPLVMSWVAIKWKAMRSAVAGLALGFAGFLAYAAWAKAPALAYLPFSFLAIPWLLLHTVICLVIARAMLRETR